MKLAILVTAIVLATTSVAHAVCGGFNVAASAIPTVPMRGSVYVHSESRRDEYRVRADWERGHGTLALKKVSTTVTRIDYAGTDGAMFRVHDGHPYSLDATYTLSSLALVELPQIVSAQRTSNNAACAESYGDFLGVELDTPVAAVRGEWHQDGATQTIWTVAWKSTYEFGDLVCGETNLAPWKLDAGGTLSVYAVLVDGREYFLRDILVGGPLLRNTITTLDPGPPAEAPWAVLATALLFVVLGGLSLCRPMDPDFPIARTVPPDKR